MSLNLTGTTTAGKFTGLVGQVGVEYILTPSPGTTAFPVGEVAVAVDTGEPLPVAGLTSLVIPLALQTAPMSGTATLADGVTPVPDGTVITATPKP